MRFKLRNPNFSTRILAVEPGKDIFDISAHRPVLNLYADRAPFKPNPVFVRADPFLFVHGQTLYLFFEQQVTTRRAVIRMTQTKDLSEWSEPVTVLKEPFHLSYPFVFEHKGNVLMMPECHQSHSIRLYKANSSLTQWTFHRTLLQGESFVDSSFIHHEGLYYLFTTIVRNGEKRLELYFADDLEGDFQRHPFSPICIGEDSAQCGGAVFRWKDAIYRPAQDSRQEYGKALKMYRITELSPQRYAERLVEGNVFPEQIPFYRHGGHHFNPVVFNGQTILATDGRQLSFNLFGFIDRVKLFLKNKFGK